MNRGGGVPPVQVCVEDQGGKGSPPLRKFAMWQSRKRALLDGQIVYPIVYPEPKCNKKAALNDDLSY
jgi:hypothetical protein